MLRLSLVDVSTCCQLLYSMGCSCFLMIFKKIFDLPFVTGETYFQGILENGWQEVCGGQAAENRPFEACGNQVGQAADMIDVDVGNDQATKMFDGKGDLQLFVRFFALKDPAIDQKATFLGDTQFVAGSGYTVPGAMVNELIARGCEHVVFSGGG